MKIGTGNIIFLLALVALVAEIVLYFAFGIGATFSGDASTATPASAVFFTCLMVLTAVTGIIAPLSAFAESLLKKPDLGYYIMVPLLGLTLAGLTVFAVSTLRSSIPAPSKIATPAEGHTSPSQARPSPGVADGAAAYESKVFVRNLKVGKSLLGETGVLGEVENTGDRTLTKVEIKVYLLDAAGKPVFEISSRPVWASETVFGRRGNEPLKPGQRRKFTIKADDAPSDWVSGISAEVVAVEFEKEVVRLNRWLSERRPGGGSKSLS